MTDSQNSREKFSFIYKIIKENADIPFRPEQFIERAKLFSTPIFNRLLLLFTFLKVCITVFYFVFFEKIFISLPIICGFILIIQCLIIMFFKNLQKFKIFSFLNLVDDYVSLRILRVIFIIVFVFEENFTLYIYKDFNFQINSGIIFAINVLVLFFESNNFSGALLYLYIVNLLSFVYFFSLRNFLNFYIPINIVIGMFILVNVVAHNIGRKLIKSETFIRFYEKVLDILSKELKVTIIYDNQVIFPHENKGNKSSDPARKSSLKVFDDLMGESQSVSSTDQDTLSVLNDKDLHRITIDDFEGFDVAFNKQEVGLRKMSFMNK